MHRATPIDTDDILYRTLTAYTPLMAEISGGVYVSERPDNSTKEDVVVNTITIDRELPATGTSNINVHVPDQQVNIGGRQQYKMNRNRIRLIANQALAALEAANPFGIGIKVQNQATIAEEATHQHYMNIRVQWMIAKEIE